MKATVIVRRREAVGVWKRLMSVLLVVLLCCPIFAVRAEEITADGRVNRALLVGCDRFLTQTDTTPSSRNNVLRMADALSGGTLNMQTLVTREDGLSSASALVALIRETFADADADDVSYFYISTHGLWNTAVNGLMTLLLSDGESEEGVTAYELRRVFDTIPGKKVLLLDADPQANATSGLGFDINLEGVYECIAGLKKPEEVLLQSPDVKNLWVLPSSIDLVAADTELPKMEDAHHVMKRIVDSVRDRFDYIFIDCSPSLGYTTVNILTAADTVLIPVQCEYLALEGLSKLLNTIRKVKSGLNPALDIEGFLLTMYMRNRLNNQVVNEVREHFGQLAYDTIIQRNIRLGEAPSHGKPVMLYDAGAVGSENYLTLAREFLKRNRKPRK